jgi:hypothetical protein
MTEIKKSVIKDVRERCYVNFGCPSKRKRRPAGPEKGKPPVGEYVPRPEAETITTNVPDGGEDTD